MIQGVAAVAETRVQPYGRAMDVTLEPASEGDIDQISAIWDAGWHEAHAEIVPPALRALRTPESFRDRARANLVGTSIARRGAEILGFCMIQDDELYQMYVSVTARGSGVAQALIEEAEARIRGAGHPLAWLACAIGNGRAGRFYEKSGWSNAGRRVVELDTSEGVFPMEVWRFEKRL